MDIALYLRFQMGNLKVEFDVPFWNIKCLFSLYCVKGIVFFAVWNVNGRKVAGGVA